MKKFFLLSLLYFLYFTTEATIRNVPATYTTIQAALNACSTGDTVLVQPGIYFENIVWPPQENIKLLSDGDSSNTFISGSNAGNVLTLAYQWVDINTIIRGFTIMEGYVTNVGGAGIFINSCSPKLEELSIKNNHLDCNNNYATGAGLYCQNSDVMVTNSSITNNYIDDATWGYGGGVWLVGGNPAFINVKINNNIITSDSYAYGGGLYLLNVLNASFFNVEINGNSVNTILHPSWCAAAGVYCTSDWILSNIFTATFTNVEIVGNSSGNYSDYNNGMGMLFMKCNGILTNVLIASNIMGLPNPNLPGYSGAGIEAEGLLGPVLLEMTNVTITDNRRADGGFVMGSGFVCHNNVTANIKNCIFWNNNSGIEIDTFGIYPVVVNISHSNVRGGFSGTGNINNASGFVSATDFHLTPGSPCVNSGTLPGAPPFDLDNMPRPAPVGTNPDMGCYELNQPVSINETDGENSLFTISPNPASEVLVCSFPDRIGTGGFEVKNKIAITITDLQGKKVYQTQPATLNQKHETKIDIRQFSKGIYFVTVDNGKQKAVKKFIKN